MNSEESSSAPSDVSWCDCSKLKEYPNACIH